MNALNELENIVEHVRKFVPELLGIIITSDDGLPIVYSISKALVLDDPVIISGLISSATSMMKNVLLEFGDEDFQLVFTQGKDISLLVGVIDNYYVGFIASSNAKIGPLFMEFKKQSEKIKNMLREF